VPGCTSNQIPKNRYLKLNISLIFWCHVTLQGFWPSVHPGIHPVANVNFLSLARGLGNPNTVSKLESGHDLSGVQYKLKVYKDTIGFYNLSSMPSSPSDSELLPPYSPQSLTFPPIPSGLTTRTALCFDPCDFLPWIRRIRFEAEQNSRILGFSNATKNLGIWYW